MTTTKGEITERENIRNVAGKRDLYANGSIGIGRSHRRGIRGHEELSSSVYDVNSEKAT